MKVGFYAGSFDPFTNGHLHVVKTASSIFDILVIGIGDNPKKLRNYDKTKMRTAIQETLEKEGIKNVAVTVYSELTVDAAKQFKADFLVRGIRNGMDYEYEENIALINSELSELDTVYIRAGNLGAISSGMVRELLRNGKDVSKYLPESVLKVVSE